MTDPASGRWQAMPPSLNVLAAFDPNKGIADILANAKDPQSDGTETIDGVACYRLKTALSPDALKALSTEVNATAPLQRAPLGRQRRLPAAARWSCGPAHDRGAAATSYAQSSSRSSTTPVEIQQPNGRLRAERAVSAARRRRPPRRPGAAAPGAGRSLAIVAAGVLLAALDQTVVVTVLYKVQEEYQIAAIHLDQLGWVVTAYLLGYTVTLPLMGRVADVFGRRRDLPGLPGAVHGRLGPGRALANAGMAGGRARGAGRGRRGAACR